MTGQAARHDRDFCDVAIVGGGYSGTVLALHLLRNLSRGHIVVIEPRTELGAGLAYSTLDNAHRINVPARQLGVSSVPEDRFIRWLETRQPGSVGGDIDQTQSFVPRHCFGKFVRDRLAAALAVSSVTLEHRSTYATDARVIDGGLELSFANGPTLSALTVAVATGHGVPALPNPLPAALSDADAFIANPWETGALARIASDDDVLIVGTGLTMADVAATLMARGHKGKIVALSRHGLLAQSASLDATPAAVDFSAWPAAPISMYVRRLRDKIARTERAGGSWRDVLTALRQQGGALWRRLSLAEKQRFVRHLKCFYDAHRYRMSPGLAARVAAARHRGQIEIVAGRLRGARRDGDAMFVDILRRGARESERRRFGFIVNCTGMRQPLDADHFLGALIARGLAYADPLGLGLMVDRDCRVFGISRNLFALGPPTREHFGDIVGAPEIAEQAQELVATLVAERDERCSADIFSDRSQFNSFVGRSP